MAPKMTRCMATTCRRSGGGGGGGRAVMLNRVLSPSVGLLLSFGILILVADMIPKVDRGARFRDHAADGRVTSKHFLQLVGQLGGWSQALALEPPLALVGVGRRLAVFDLKDVAQPLLVGQSPFLPDAVSAVDVVGDLAYVANLDGGMTLIDVATAQQPRILGGVQAVVADGAAAGAFDLEVVGRWAYLATSQGLAVIDVAVPRDPQLVTVIKTDGVATALALGGGYAYVSAQRDGLVVYDLTQADAPVAVGVLRDVSFGKDLVFSGANVYVIDAEGMKVIDVREPRAPNLIGTLALADAPMQLQLVGDRAYVIQLLGSLREVDLSSPRSPRILARADLPPPSKALSVAVAGSIAGVVTTHGLLTFDLEEGGTPRPLGNVHWPGRITGLDAVGDLVLAADSASGILNAVDSSSGGDPHVLDWEPIENAYDVTTLDGLAYVAADDSGLAVVDVHRPDAMRSLFGPSHVQPGGIPGSPRDLHVVGNTAYVATWTRGLAVFDVANGEPPQHLGQVVSGGRAQNVSVVDGHAFLAANNAGVLVIDVADPRAPRLVSTIDTGGDAYGVFAASGLVYVAGSAGLSILDASDPTRLRALGVADTRPYGSAVDVVVEGNLAFVAATRALLVYDLSDLTAPRRTAERIAPGELADLALAGDKIYVAAQNGGLLIYRHLASVHDPLLLPVLVVGD